MEKTMKVEDGVWECTPADGVCVQRVDSRILDGIDQSDYSWCNTCNHRDTEAYAEKMAQEQQQQQQQQHHGDDNDDSNNVGWYQQTMDETRMEKWQSALGDLTSQQPHCVFTITASQQRKYFKGQAAQVAKQGARAKNLLRDEAEELAGELQQAFFDYNSTCLEPPDNGDGWFVRTSACSPKDAQDDGGAGPHKSLINVLLALFASDRVHTSMRDYGTDTKVYLIPFDRAVTVERELRVFVHDHKVTAMSQYDVYNDSSVFMPMDDTELAAVARCVDNFHRDKVVPRWTGIASYIMDVEYIAAGGETKEEDGSSGAVVRLIELNSFGAEMAAASALFHWVRDAKELHSSERICIRVRGGKMKDKPSSSSSSSVGADLYGC